MTSYNTSLAYKLPSVQQESVKESSSPDLKVVKTRRQIAVSVLTPGVLCGFIMVVTLVSLMVYNRVHLNELTSEINDLSHEMQLLQSENIKMVGALESTLLFGEIAERASAMGMQPRSEFQTERIYLYQENIIERGEYAPKATAGESAKLAIMSVFSRFKEYLTVR